MTGIDTLHFKFFVDYLGYLTFSDRCHSLSSMLCTGVSFLEANVPCFSFVIKISKKTKQKCFVPEVLQPLVGTWKYWETGYGKKNSIS